MTVVDNVRAVTDFTALDHKTRELTPMQIIAEEINSRVAQYALALRGDKAAAQRLAFDALSALRSTPKLAQCEPMSVIGALMTCAQLGLRPGVLGSCYILPFWSRKQGRFMAQFVIGYKGLTDLAHRSGSVRSIVARTVYQQEVPAFKLSWHGDRDELFHEPWLAPGRGAPTLFYSRALTVNGGYQLTRPSNVPDMIAYRDEHATQRDTSGKVYGPWVDHFEAMCWKTHIRWNCKTLPMTAELERGLYADGTVRTDDSPHADVTHVAAPAGPGTIEAEEVDPGTSDEHPGARQDDEQPWGGRRG